MKRLLLILLLIPSIAFGFLPPGAEVPLPDDTPYNATSWDGNVSAATKNAIRDKIEAMSGAAVWGGITGTLSNQTDLQNALDAKEGTLTNAAGLYAALSDVSAFAELDTLQEWTESQEMADDKCWEFGNDKDLKMCWDSADARLEFREVGNAPRFWFDLANYSFGVAAVASPEMSGFDSGADGSERTDEWAFSIAGNFTDGTEDAEISDVTFHAMMSGTKITWGEWDGSDESFTMGDGGTGEDIKWDFETATDNEIAVSSPAGATDINWGSLNHETTGIISGGVKIIVDADGGDADAYCYGGVWYATGAGVIALPAVATGMSLTVINDTADTVQIDPDGTEVIKIDGISAAAGELIEGTDLNDMAVCTYYSAGVWFCATVGYEEDTPP